MAVRTLVAGAVTAPLVTGVVLGSTAGPATADSDDIHSPRPDAVVSEERRVEIKAEGSELRLRAPRDDTFHTVDAEGRALRYRLDLACFNYDKSCSGKRPAPNGTYAVRVTTDGLLGITHDRDSRTFTVRVPPRKPEDVTAAVASGGKVKVKWDKGPEPDLAAYVVRDASGSKMRRVAAEKACDGGSSCAATVSVDQSDARGRMSLSVTARRYASTDRESTIASPSSEAAVDVATPGPQTQTSTHDRDRRGAAAARSERQSPETQASSPGPEGTARPPSRLPSLALSSTSPHTGGPARQGEKKLQGKSGQSASEKRTPAPTPRGSAGAVSDPASSSHPPEGTAATRSMTSPMAPSEWWKTVALGLVLLLVAAHLGAWTWRTRPEPPRGGSSRKAGRISKRHARSPGSPAATLAAEASAARERSGEDTTTTPGSDDDLR